MTQGIYHSPGVLHPQSTAFMSGLIEPGLPLPHQLSRDLIFVYVQMNKCPDHLERSCFSGSLICGAKTQ